MSDDLLSLLQQQMVDIIAAHAQLVSEQIGKERLDERVLAVMRRIPRHGFVPVELAPYAYADQPLPIGFDKTISQPFIVALMTDLLDVKADHRVLEVGTGLGYHTAILAELASDVFTVEIVEELGEKARKQFDSLGLGNIVARIGNGENGWPEYAPFDRILVCAASELIPPMLLKQLAPGGKMVVPTGMPDSQTLLFVEKNEAGRVCTREVLPVRFALLECAH
ncbi:MAG: protein-L-isoaspartate(D-aspartate) O-methyltransferase [Rhodospirillales bacterium]|nr:protein-L-isoaspartate(D-aspartate) O-methyltransferase [Rhodospirillales bacterium]